MLEVAAFDALLLDLIRPDALYAVGGRVRDEIRAQYGQTELAIKDADYVVTGYTFDELRAALDPHGRVDQVGASFSVLKFTRDRETVDIALPRREISTGVGHRDFVIESGPEVSLLDDLSRRDFRMNMIARSIESGRLIDPYGGEADIAARQIDILAERTFEEDPLRMLRACQFAARFDYAVTARAHDGIAAASDLIDSVSPQRVGEEFMKLLRLAQKPSIGFELMRTTGLLAKLWPELLEGFGVEQNDWHAYDVYHHNLETVDSVAPGDGILRLAALLHDVGKPRVKDGPHFYRHEVVGAEMAGAMLTRIACSNEVVDTTTHLIRQHMFSSDSIQTDAAIRRFIKRIGAEHLERLFILRQADICGSGLPKRNGDNELFESRVYSELAAQQPVRIGDLAIGGVDVIAILRESGAAIDAKGDARVGIVLRELLERVLDRPQLNERETLRGLAQEIIVEQRLAAP